MRGVACLELAPVRRPRRASAAIAGAGAWTTGPVVVAAAVAFLALAPTPAWHLILGIRSSALSIFVIVMAAVVVAPPTVHLVTAVAIAIAATAATPYATWMHSNRLQQGGPNIHSCGGEIMCEARKERWLR